MGFSGGGSNITKAHTHDSTIVQDGGSLAANVTQFGLAAGSVLYSDGSNIQELAVGSAADVLTVNGAATAPEWATAGGGLANTNRQVISGMTNGQTTTSTVFVDITNGSATLTNSAGGSAFIYFSYCCENSSIGVGGACVNIGGVDTSQIEDQTAPTSYRACISGCGAMASTNGDTVQTRWRTGSGTRLLYNQALRESLCQIFEIY